MSETKNKLGVSMIDGVMVVQSTLIDADGCDELLSMLEANKPFLRDKEDKTDD